MPKAIFEFSLPEEAEEFEIYSKAQDMHSALWHFSNDVLRAMDKHGAIDSRELTSEEHRIVVAIRDRFHTILDEYGVEL